MIVSRPPCAPCRSLVLSHLFFVEAVRFWLVVVFFYVVLRPSKATTYFYFCLFLPLSSPPQMTAKRPPHTFRRGRVPSPIFLPLTTPTFGWLLCFHIKRRPPTAMAPSPSLFIFIDLFRQPKRRHGVPPTRSATVARPPRHPLHRPGRLLLDCCVSFQNGGHLQGQGTPLSPLFFDPSLSSPPNGQTNDSERKPDGSRHGAWRWGAAASWLNGTAALPTEREGKAAGWRRLELVVVCVVLCVVFFVFCVVFALFFTHFVTTHANTLPLSTTITNAPP
jgi:hypothetical protein